MREMFITIEGIDGCGKSTQAVLLKKAVEETGVKVLLTREPGGSSIGELIRNALLTKVMSNTTEFLLFAADRNEHIEGLILPALQSGTIVISDRFTDSSVAYQGYGRGVDIDFIKSVHNFITKGLYPDLTILIDVPPEISFERRKVTSLDRIEKEGVSFLKTVRDGYIKIASEEKERFAIVDGRESLNIVSERIFRIFVERREKWKNRKS
ncbi:MAG: dTMP kinase [Caldisericaceae bacterium]